MKEIRMIDVVVESDIGEIRELIAKCVRTSVVSSEAEAEFLIKDIGANSLDRWLSNKAESCHLKYVLEGKIVGVILIANYSKLCGLFVHPSYYKQGIGRGLFEAAASVCRERSDVEKITLNSSTFASGFYETIGFIQTGPALDRPGGCIPYEYTLWQKN